MKVKQRLRINTLVMALSVIAILAVFLAAAHRVTRAMEQNNIADALVATQFERLMFRTDYLRTDSERAREQTRAKYRQISDLLASASDKFTDPEDRKTIAALMESQESIGKVFNSIVANRQDSPDRGSDLSAENENRLLSQLDMRIYEALLFGGRLQASANDALITALKLAGGSIFIVLVLVSAVILMNSRTMSRAITDRAGRLRDGAAMIGSGTLDHRIDVRGNDEFGEVAEAFNSMSAQLMASYLKLENEIGERKRAEEAFQASEERLRLMGDNLPESAVYQYVYEPDGKPRFLYFSAGIEHLNGVSVSDVLNDADTLHRQIPPEYREQLAAAEARSARELCDFDMDVPMHRPDGQVRWMRLHSRPRRLPDGSTIWDGVQTDITERKRAEEELRTRESDLNEAQRLAHIGSWHWDATTDVTTGSDELLRIYGFDPLRESMPDFTAQRGTCYPADDWERINAAVNHTLATGVGYELDVRVIRNGGMAWVTTRGEAVRDADNRIVGLRGTVQDISHRKQSDEALRSSRVAALNLMEDAVAARKRAEKVTEALLESEERLRLFIEHAPASLAMFDREMRYLSVSRRWLSDYGLGDRIVNGLSYYDVFPKIPERWKAIHRRALAGEVIRSDEDRFDRDDGSTQWLRWEVRPWHDSAGNVAGIVIFSEDITGSMLATEALRRNTERFALLAETAEALLASGNSQEIVEELCGKVMAHLDLDVFFNFLVDPASNRLHLNACAGIAPEDAAQLEWLDYGIAVCGCVARDCERIIAEDIQHADNERTALVKSLGVKAYCCHPLMAGDRLLGTLSFGSRRRAHFDSDEIELLQMVSSQASIAMERIRTGQALQESESFYRQTLESIPGMVFTTRPDGYCDYQSQQWVDFTGVPMSEHLGDGWNRLLHPDDRPKAFDAWRAAVEGRASYDLEYRVRRHDGQYEWFKVLGRPIRDASGQIVRWFGVAANIDAIKQAEETLRVAHAELETKVRERTTELVSTNLELEQKTDELNERVEELNCLYTLSHLLTDMNAPLEIILRQAVALLPAAWRFHETAGARIVLDGLEAETNNYLDTPWQLQKPIRIRGNIVGTVKIAYLNQTDHNTSLYMQEESFMETVADMFGDFMERRHIRAMLEESELRYRGVSQQLHALLDAIPDILVLLSADLTILWANWAAALQADLVPKDLIGQPCARIGIAPADSDTISPVQACFASGHPATARVGGPETAIWDVKTLPVKDDSGAVKNVILVARDITGELRLQEETIRSGRLASLGELAAGVAHEINNPINAIINYAQILANKADRTMKEYEFTGEIVREGERIAGIVRGLLAFARDSRDTKYPTAIRDVLHATGVLTNAHLKRDGIEERIRIPEDLPQVCANQQQLQQVFLNLISNARHALNKKYPGLHPDKILEIIADQRTVDGVPYVSIEVRDHGTGIPRSILERVTDPFFTTKPAGEGTGLGLSITTGIVANHGGQLSIESAEGKYTRVIIELPVEPSQELS